MTREGQVLSKLFTRLVALWPYVLVGISVIGLTLKMVGATR